MSWFGRHTPPDVIHGNFADGFSLDRTPLYLTEFKAVLNP